MMPPPAPPAQARHRLATLDKMADLLRAFTPERPAWRLHEIATFLAWDRATTLRFLEKLVELTFLERDEHGVYRHGRLIPELGALYLGASPARQRLVRMVERVHARTGLTTQVGYLDRSAVVIALSEEGTTLVKVAASPGARLPVYATAIGKVILAQLEDAAASAVLPARLEALTPNTIRSRRALRAEIDAVRASGSAHARAELAEGLDAWAVPIPGSLFGAPAGLGCAGPSVAVEGARAEVVAALQDAAAELRALSGR
jgi:DNA-binding IclR family transcriptional regulator